jgi:hypothetical protein
MVERNCDFARLASRASMACRCASSLSSCALSASSCSRMLAITSRWFICAASAPALRESRWSRALSMAMAQRAPRSPASSTSAGAYWCPVSALTSVSAPSTWSRAIRGTTITEPIPSARSVRRFSSSRATATSISSPTHGITSISRVRTARGAPSGSSRLGGQLFTNPAASSCLWRSGCTMATRRMEPSASTTSTMHHEPRKGSASVVTVRNVAS